MGSPNVGQRISVPGSEHSQAQSSQIQSCGEMPLSEDEQRILKEIEENLSATDPKLVQQVSDTTLYRHSARVDGSLPVQSSRPTPGCGFS